MAEIKIDHVDVVTRMKIMETIIYVKAHDVSLTDGESAGIDSLSKELDRYEHSGNVTLKMDEDHARDAHAGIRKGLPAGSREEVSGRFYGETFDVQQAIRVVDEVFGRCRPVGYDMVVMLLDAPVFTHGGRARSYYLGLSEDGEIVAIKSENWHRFMSRLGAERCQEHGPAMRLLDCSESQRLLPDDITFPADIQYRKVYCMDMEFAAPRQQEAYERAMQTCRLAVAFNDILAGDDRLTKHIENEIAEIDTQIAELKALRDCIKR